MIKAIKYIPGPKVPVADALRRVHPNGKTFLKGLDVTIHKIAPQCKIHVKVQEFKQATKKGQIIQLLMQQPKESWPEHCKNHITY